MHNHLRTWFAALPEELRLGSESDSDDDADIARMQAMALQLAYDNIQIVLHRQAVFLPQPIEAPNQHSAASKDQLVESAIRTSLVPNSKTVLPISRSSHAAMHVAICIFTAGVVLSGLYLSGDFDSRSDELLSGLERIIAFFEHFPGQHFNLVAQSLHILQALQSKCHSSGGGRSQQGPVSDVTRSGKGKSLPIRHVLLC